MKLIGEGRWRGRRERKYEEGIDGKILKGRKGKEKKERKDTQPRQYYLLVFSVLK